MSTAVAMPEVEEVVREDHESQDELARLYHVILLNDDDHTDLYVVEMLCEIFSFTEEKAYDHVIEVDTEGHTRLTTCSLPEAEKKRDQVHAYGADWRLERSLGSMAALIEPAD
jgi:ATP-dependent Clp protease adaptor protein ClpS